MNTMEMPTVDTLVWSAARQNPNGVAVVSQAGSETWSAFAWRVSQIAGALIKNGLEPGMHVCLLAGNSPAHLATTYAVWAAGAVLVPLNIRLSSSELGAILSHVEAAALLFDAAHANTAHTIAAECQISRALQIENLDDLREPTPTGRLPTMPTILRSGEDRDIAGIIYTGGTTGTPKGAMLTGRSFLRQAEILLNIMRHDTMSVYLHTSPLFHLSGLTHTHGITLAAGTHVFPGSTKPDDVFASIADHGVNVLGLVPTYLATLLENASGHKAALQRIEHVGYGASPISEPLLRRAIQELPNASFHQVYGQTEAGGSCLTLPPEAHRLEESSRERLSMAGIPLPGFDVRIFGEHDRECISGETGEIVVRGEGVMARYWRDPARTLEVLRNGWLRTGDMGRRDEDGYIAVVGRLKDLIITGGENVYAGEVERVLEALPGVRSCAVVGVPDPYWGEAVHAFVVRELGARLTEPDIRQFCRSHIAAYKCPKRVWVDDKPLPLTGVGKIMKSKLREQALALMTTASGPTILSEPAASTD
ncbi:class I adenylate-forming enzyme family protein [Bradyrhizobium yuanmingense]|uniref:class I adenylate-forming enzyme family protein n=1 Tax=Bradyrhizobium yuanmingense TaxID=108015 RepID=UPI0023B939EF|nr:AMP-binding protein [Bradyrhizobium yuanmingense]MDF0498185.1 AMP-binding protein [Bradyrhizobium yuanmingense]